jgi:hypothetical protein
MARSKLSPVMLIHGIRTNGEWQKQFADALSDPAVTLPHHTHDFGNFSIWRFRSRRQRDQKVDHFYDWYCHIRSRAVARPERNRDFRPSVVAHSFGSYIVGHALRKYADLTLGRVILCGSILPVDFDWTTVVGRSQLWEVTNDYGVVDFWAGHAHWLVPDAGPSGARGFELDSPLVRNRRFEYHLHSDYFREGHYHTWIRILQRPAVEFQTVRSSELDASRWQEMKGQMRKLDEAVYGVEGMISDDTRSTKWLAANPDIYTVLVDKHDRVHGYLNAMPVSPETFEALLRGDRDDNSVSASDIITYQNDGIVDLYLMSINVHPDSRRLEDGANQSAFHHLLSGLIRQLESLAKERNIFVRRLGAVAWTDEGKRLCELLGMRPHALDQRGHPTFLSDFGQEGALNGHKLLRRLQALYRSRDPG